MNKGNIPLLRPGEWMNGFSETIAAVLAEREELCFRLNSLPPSRKDERNGIINELLESVGKNFDIHSPFRCDFGFNIRIGDNFTSNFNLTILDEAQVTIGNNVFIGPNTTITTITHALDATQRNAGIMCAQPVTIGDNVWIAACVTILPGVTIGEGAVIGAGSVVTKSIPAGVLAVGNPCKVVRKIGGE